MYFFLYVFLIFIYIFPCVAKEIQTVPGKRDPPHDNDNSAPDQNVCPSEVNFGWQGSSASRARCPSSVQFSSVQFSSVQFSSVQFSSVQCPVVAHLTHPWRPCAGPKVDRWTGGQAPCLLGRRKNHPPLRRPWTRVNVRSPSSPPGLQLHTHACYVFEGH